MARVSGPPQIPVSCQCCLLAPARSRRLCDPAHHTLDERCWTPVLLKEGQGFQVTFVGVYLPQRCYGFGSAHGLYSWSTCKECGVQDAIDDGRDRRAPPVPTQRLANYPAIFAVHSFATPVHWLWGDEASTQTLAQSMQATDIRRLP